MLDRASNAEALFREQERAQVTLNSMGDAVVCTDGHNEAQPSTTDPRKTPAGIGMVVCSPPNVVYDVYQDPHWNPQR